MITAPQVFKSLAASVIAALAEIDVADIESLPIVSGRPALDYEAQPMPLFYGPTGTADSPAIVIEFGTGRNYRWGELCPVVVSLTRNIDRDSRGGSSYERTQQTLGELANKIRPLIFTTKTCPVYVFQPDSWGIVSTVGKLDWHNERLGTNEPTERFVGEAGPGGWLRWLAEFEGFYRLS